MPPHAMSVKKGVKIEIVSIIWMVIDATLGLVSYVANEGWEAVQEARGSEYASECCH